MPHAPPFVLLFALLLGGCSLNKADVPRRTLDAGDTGPDSGRPTSTCAMCDPLAQTGCRPGADCHIDPYLADEPAVCETPGTGTRNQPCSTMPDTCAPGLACASSSWGCLPLCAQNADCPNPGEVCIELSADACVGVCSELCSVLNDTGCDVPERPVCGPVTGGLPRGNLCRRVTMDLGEGEVCTHFEQCAAGHFCAAATGTCLRIEDCADIMVPGDCSTDERKQNVGTDPDGTQLCICVD